MRLIDAEQMALDESEAYMKAQAQIEDVNLLRANLLVHAKLQKLLADAPTVDAVPVVRCWECTHFYTDEYGFPACAESEAMLSPEEDDYCSRGQRRDSSADVRNMPEEVK